MKDYISNLYKVLFEFDFSGIKDSTTIPRAVLTILWTSLFLFVVKNINLGGFWGDFKFLSGMIFYLIGMYFVWFFTAIFFEFVMKIFGKAGKIRTLLTLSSYCLLPYIFIAPFELMKKFWKQERHTKNSMKNTKNKSSLNMMKLSRRAVCIL